VKNGDRPNFRRQGIDGRGSIPFQAARYRVRTMAALLLVVVALLIVRWQRQSPIVSTNVEVVEVRGEVPSPGFVGLSPPATLHKAIAAAGGDPSGLADIELSHGTRVVLNGGQAHVESMDELLVLGLPIDINQASAQALETIPGIGPSKAAAIVKERTAEGAFASVDALVRVKGIGDATVEQMRPFVTVQGESLDH